MAFASALGTPRSELSSAIEQPWHIDLQAEAMARDDSLPLYSTPWDKQHHRLLDERAFRPESMEMGQVQRLPPTKNAYARYPRSKRASSALHESTCDRREADLEKSIRASCRHSLLPDVPSMENDAPQRLGSECTWVPFFRSFFAANSGNTTENRKQAVSLCKLRIVQLSSQTLPFNANAVCEQLFDLIFQDADSDKQWSRLSVAPPRHANQADDARTRGKLASFKTASMNRDAFVNETELDDGAEPVAPSRTNSVTVSLPAFRHIWRHCKPLLAKMQVQPLALDPRTWLTLARPPLEMAALAVLVLEALFGQDVVQHALETHFTRECRCADETKHELLTQDFAIASPLFTAVKHDSARGARRNSTESIRRRATGSIANPVPIFNNPTWTSLDLEEMGYTSLASNCFTSMSMLTYLSLAYNYITNVPVGVFATLTRLRSLYFNFNFITSIPEGTFSNLNSLTTLYMSNNYISLLPTYFPPITN